MMQLPYDKAGGKSGILTVSNVEISSTIIYSLPEY
jgi:hypothetical protein